MRCTLVTLPESSRASDMAGLAVPIVQSSNWTSVSTPIRVRPSIIVSKDAGVKYKMNERWSLKLNGRYSRLVGDAADSPVIETEDQFSGSANITYKFSR
ncbi:MAG: MipA/OmpV family protein, partial [Pseudomonadota bacterium]